MASNDVRINPRYRWLAGISLTFYIPFLFWLLGVLDLPDGGTYLDYLVGFWIILGYLALVAFGFFLALVTFDPVE